DFQELAGLRRHLLRVCPAGRAFTTLLLSATMTPACIRLLQNLFAPADAVLWKEVRYPELRPEPEYWFGRCDDQDQRNVRVLDVLAHAPRPLILYSSLVNLKSIRGAPVVWGSRDYARLLREAGYRRVEVFDGCTPGRRREQILRRWTADDLDVVVGTAAFGLGVDKPDVRTVVHACVPESLDRYYQE